MRENIVGVHGLRIDRDRLLQSRNRLGKSSAPKQGGPESNMIARILIVVRYGNLIADNRILPVFPSSIRGTKIEVRRSELGSQTSRLGERLNGGIIAFKPEKHDSNLVECKGIVRLQPNYFLKFGDSLIRLLVPHIRLRQS